MITLHPDIDRDMLLQSPADAADERVALDAVLAEAEKPGWFQGDERILAVALVTDDAGLEFRGRGLSSTLPAGDEENEDVLRSVAKILAENIVMEFEVELMLKLVGPDSAVERRNGATFEIRAAWHRLAASPFQAAVMNAQTATVLRDRFGVDDLAHALDTALVVIGTTEISGRPLWGSRVLLTRTLPVAKRVRWNGEIRGATVDRGWWATVRRRAEDGRKVVTVGRYETPLELCGLDAAIIVDVKGES